MNLELAKILPTLLPQVIAWAQAQAATMAVSGEGLTAEGLALARRVGVSDPERIRVQSVTQIPLPTDPTLRQVAVQTGLLGTGTIGLALGHGIYIRKGHESARLLSHECRHVHQYEQAGSIAAFLPIYLRQIVEFGYFDAPFEVDARAHEVVE